MEFYQYLIAAYQEVETTVAKSYHNSNIIELLSSITDLENTHIELFTLYDGSTWSDSPGIGYHRFLNKMLALSKKHNRQFEYDLFYSRVYWKNKISLRNMSFE